MTATMEAPTTSTATVTVAVQASDAARQFTNVALFASKDAARPVLQHALATIEEGRLVLVATDSYGLVRVTLPIDLMATGSVLELPENTMIPASLLTAAAKAAKAQRTGGNLVTMTVDAVSVTFAGDGWQVTDPTGDGEYPPHRNLWPSTEPTGTPMYALATAAYARLGKLKGDGSTGGTVFDAVKLEAWGALKSCRFTIGADITGLYMPVRVS